MTKSELRIKRHDLFNKLQQYHITKYNIDHFKELQKEYNSLCEQWNALVIK
jgi:hypothetical protein